nr:uncharacterized protein LOC129165102 [Nothobranchius furzeri]
MGRTCCVVGCNIKSHDREGNELENGLSFYSFPAWKQRKGAHVSDVTKRRLLTWIAAVRRVDLQFSTITKYLLVCSRHVYSGKPAYEMDETSPDWIPTLHMGHSEVSASKSDRHARRRQRMKIKGGGVQYEAADGEGDTPSKVLDVELPEMDLTDKQHRDHLMTEAVVQGNVEKVKAGTAFVEDGHQTEGETEEKCQKMECEQNRAEINRSLAESRRLRSELEKGS